MKTDFMSRVSKVSVRSGLLITTLAFAASMLVVPFGRAQALVTSPVAAPKVSFTFDDGLSSAVTQAAPTLAKYGFTGTDYVITNCVGMTKVPNKCHANGDASYMSWAQITQLQNSYGWEIGSHTQTHPYLATSDPDDQPKPISAAQVTKELANSKKTLNSKGFAANSFATPYGDYNMPVLSEIAKYYSTQRGFGDVGYNSWPYSDYFLKVQQVQAGVTVAQVKSYVDTAIANHQWLILVMHDIKTNASTDPLDYEYKTSDLDQIAAYIKSQNVQVVNVSQGQVTSDVNLLPNSTFNNGIANGWTTDSPSTITANSANKGSFPNSTKSIKLSAGANFAHLFSPKVAVSSNTTYMLKNYLNVESRTSGEVGFYIDEYDGFGNWISGQFKAAEPSVFVESLNFTYKPTSNRVAKAALQVYVSGGSGITAYLDNSQWFPLVTETPAPVPTPTNLMPNASFDAGISNGWHTNSPTTIMADGANNGSPENPVYSVKMTAATANRHLFSPLIGVAADKTYSLSAYLNLKQLASGEVGFYIDEYDGAGNWISGQYKGGVSALGAGQVDFSYQPSSSQVASASLQVVVVGNSNTLAYLDNIIWYQN